MCQQWLKTGLSWHYGGLIAHKYTDHIIRLHARISEGFLANAVIDVLLCSAKGLDINIIEIIWSYKSRRINEMNPLPGNTTGLRAAVHDEWQSVTQARFRRFSDQRCTPIRAIVQAPCQLSMNSWMDFLNCHCLCVKFSLRLMHNIHSLLHVEKSILKGYFQPIKANKNLFRKNINFFSARYLGTMLTYNNQIRFLKFCTLHSCPIGLILEELKDIKWIWHQEIRIPCMLLWHYLHYYMSDTNQIRSTASQYTTLCYWSFIFVQNRG